MKKVRASLEVMVRYVSEDCEHVTIGSETVPLIFDDDPEEIHAYVDVVLSNCVKVLREAQEENIEARGENSG